VLSLQKVNRTLILFSLISLGWRVDILYHNKTIQVISIPDKDVWIIVSVCFVISVALLAIFSGVSGMEFDVEVPDPYRPSNNIPVCSAGGAKYWVPLGLIIGTLVVLSIWGIIITIRIRDIKFKVYNESKVIAFVMYNW